MKAFLFKSAVIFSFTITLILLSCSKEQGSALPVDPVPISLTSDQLSLIESENSFAFDIFKKILENTDATENIIISPLSISLALSMTMNGANGSTKDAMLDALRVNGINPEDINNSYKNLTEALLNVDQRVLISIANSVWTENNFDVKSQFKNILTESYNAEAKSFDISDPLTPDIINTWIESKTNGLIKDMVESMNENTVMLLINAIYFKGKWKSQFDSESTVQRTFYKSNDMSSEVSMMKQTSDYKIYTGNEFVLAEFPYGQGNFVMDIFLPNENDGINTLISYLSDNSFKEMLNQLDERETDLTMPRFKYGFKKQLKDILTELGMGIAFTDIADFSNISDISLLINDVTHQAFIETNEEGTEAAAATIVDIGFTSLPAEPFILNIDHTFLYIIRETTTNTILFMGRVSDPLAE